MALSRRAISTARAMVAAPIRRAPLQFSQQCLQAERIVARPLRSIESLRASSPFQRRQYSSETPKATRIYEFKDVQSLVASPSPSRILIDVREPSEYAEGHIPGASNIPVKSSPDALFLNEEEFEDRFGFGKPGKDAEVVFYCRSGVRSGAAANLAGQCGYENISEYKGSWLDWEGNGGEIAR